MQIAALTASHRTRSKRIFVHPTRRQTGQLMSIQYYIRLCMLHAYIIKCNGFRNLIGFTFFGTPLVNHTWKTTRGNRRKKRKKGVEEKKTNERILEVLEDQQQCVRSSNMFFILPRLVVYMISVVWSDGHRVTYVDVLHIAVHAAVIFLASDDIDRSLYWRWPAKKTTEVKALETMPLQTAGHLYCASTTLRNYIYTPLKWVFWWSIRFMRLLEVHSHIRHQQIRRRSRLRGSCLKWVESRILDNICIIWNELPSSFEN